MALQTWQLDKGHSEIHFTVRHMVVAKVRGRFSRWDGTLLLDEADLSKSSVEVTIEAASIDTNEAQRDGHLRSPDFLDVEKYPTIKFKSTAVRSTGGSNLSVTGELTIRDISKSVTLEVSNLGKIRDPWGNNKMAFSGKIAVQREDFGAKWNQVLEAGGVLIGKQVDVDLEVQAIAPKAE
jgi:polyisoprenoid-binding protein YceI